MRLLAAAFLLLPTGMTDAEYQKLRPDLRLKSRGWASLPWRATLTEAREAALREKKPIFMMVDTGNPIGFA
jgi:hypothetical protein